MSTEADNVRNWDGVARPHYEVWYLTFNHRESGTGYWICYTLDAPASGHFEVGRLQRDRAIEREQLVVE